MKTRLFLTSFILFSFISCTNKENNDYMIMYDEDTWENITVKFTPIPVKLPQIYNIEKISKVQDYILLKNDDTEPLFSLINPKNMAEISSWGNIGQGPKEFSQTAMLVNGNDEYIRIYDNYSIQKYLYFNDTINYIEKINCKKEPDFLQSIYAINDSLIFGYKYAPHETGLHLMDIKSKNSFSSISVNEGYFDNKDTPYEFNFTVFGDKIILGRTRFNQIELYQIIHNENSIKKLFIINYNHSSPEKIDEEKACYMININADEKYFYMLNQDTDTPGQKTYIDIYSWEGEAIKRIELDDLYLQGILIDNTMYLKNYNDDDNLYVIDFKSIT